MPTTHPKFNYQPEKTGVLITNLGTPDAPTPAAVRRYLKEFLSDPRVVALPKLIWQPILNGLILPTRPKRSAKQYQKIWQADGSPLLTITRAQAEKLQQHFNGKQDNIVVKFAMRYGNPNIVNALEAFRAEGIYRLLIFPLYPQYSATTTAATFDAVSHALKKTVWLPELQFINHYFDHPEYISAVANSIKNFWQQHERAQMLVFSFHGLPEKNLQDGDPYHCFCQKSARLIAEQLALPPETYRVTFQSRFGYAKWLSPYTDKTLMALPKNNIQSVQVVTPGFAADCLETLEEINIQNRHFFMQAGGKKFDYIPALNASDSHIRALAHIIEPHLPC